MILKFTVSGQHITLDSTDEATKLVPGSKGCVVAQFSFSPEWKDYAKVVSFHSRLGRECGALILKNGSSCIIPAEALSKRIFKVQLHGKKSDSVMVTDKATVVQNGGKA